MVILASFPVLQGLLGMTGTHLPRDMELQFPCPRQTYVINHSTVHPMGRTVSTNGSGGSQVKPFESALLELQR